MKKCYYLLIILISILSIDLRAQTPQEITRQQTYWNYRNRLKQDFNKIGYDRGNSFTASRHQFADYDGNYPYTCIGNETGGLIQWGDALAHHGTYLAMLASEYKLLIINNQPTDETLVELYYAIFALTRLDKNFDEYHGSLVPNESGVLGRDDILIGYENNWDFTIPNNPALGSKIMMAEAQSTHDDNCTPITYQEKNIWSKDHIANLLFGLCMVKS